MLPARFALAALAARGAADDGRRNSPDSAYNTSNGNWELLSSKCPRWFVEARGNVGVDFEAAAGEAEL